jgi:hypothetical protein
MVAVVVGMAALAIDGARAYALRRDLQAATDAAALAAGDSYQQFRNYITAESAATTSFGQNIRLYVSPSCSPAYGAPPRTITCNYSDHTVLTEAVTALGAAGVQFTIGGTRSLVLQFARILTSGSSPQLSAIASAGVNNLLYTPTVAALSQAGCGGMPGNAITTTSGGTLNIVGDMVSTGAISIAGSASITGDVYARCQSSVAGVTTTCYPSGDLPPCTYPDVAGVTRSGYNFADPGYPAPPLVGSAQPRPPTGGGPVVLAPGSYAMDPAFGTGLCYFLAGGVYKWQGGYTNNGSFVSNELRPPDEPMYNNNTIIAGHQLWNTDSVDCAGSFQVNSQSGSPVIPREGTWAFMLTSVRTAIYNGVSYTRESAPSMCRTVFVGDGQVVQIQVSNVPGAGSYNVYAAPSNGCSGQFGLAGSINVVGSVQNTATMGGVCPAFSGTGCSLGHESAVFDGGPLGTGFILNALGAPGVVGSPPPDGETSPLRSNLPNENANRASPPHGDRANENQCDTVAAALTTCAGPITPGAVAFVIPSGGCLNDTTSGDNVVFSGYQYNWMVVYEPGAAYPPANTCSNFIGAATDSAFIGFFYAPSAAITISKASSFRTDEVGGVMGNTLTFSGQLPTILGDPAEYGPVPPAAKLTS